MAHEWHDHNEEPSTPLSLFGAMEAVRQWSQMAIERAKRIEELEAEVARLKREVYELEGDVAEYEAEHGMVT